MYLNTTTKIILLKSGKIYYLFYQFLIYIFILKYFLKYCQEY